MSLSEIVFIVNPNAGNGSTGSDWPIIKKLARDRLGPFTTYITSGPGDAILLTKEAIVKGAGLVVCVGGDGTLNEVVNGYMEQKNSARADLRLGFVPNGTGCDFAKTALIPRDIEESINLIVTNKVRSIDVGRLGFKDHNGFSCSRFFLNIASFGLGGEVVERVNRTTKAFGPFLSFIWATLISIFLYGKKRINISIDDDFQDKISIWNIMVANGRYQGGGMLVAPDASMDDGLFNVTVIGNLSLAEVLINLPNLYNGKIYDINKVTTHTGKKVEASSEQDVLLDIDGEQPGKLPVSIDILPDSLNIIGKE